MIKPQTLKGFRDFLPEQAKKRQYVINKLKTVFESYGFEPLETPALEYEEVLLGRYGQEGDKLMYRFEDNGKRRVALRYDQTVPLARVVAQYQNELPMPFKRYQIQPVWRAENTQKGRFREFLQCDADIVGIDSPLADAEVISLVKSCLVALGCEFTILINDRENLKFTKLQLAPDKNLKVVGIIDKLQKIGRESVLEELTKEGFSKQEAEVIMREVEQTKPTKRIEEVIKLLKYMNCAVEEMEFSPTLARGMDYYTGIIFEVEIKGYINGSVCGGGRYDNLIGMFANRKIPAVGFAFGFDRLMEAMEQLDLFPAELTTSQVLITVFSPELKDKSIELSSRLRSNNINTELYLDENGKMEKQLKYADQKGIPYVVIIGPDEAAKEMVTLRNMKTREQKTISQNELITELTR